MQNYLDMLSEESDVELTTPPLSKVVPSPPEPIIIGHIGHPLEHKSKPLVSNPVQSAKNSVGSPTVDYPDITPLSSTTSGNLATPDVLHIASRRSISSVTKDEPTAFEASVLQILGEIRDSILRMEDELGNLRARSPYANYPFQIDEDEEPTTEYDVEDVKTYKLSDGEDDDTGNDEEGDEADDDDAYNVE